MIDFKIRASGSGQIMTNDRSGKAMGKTAMSYCEMWLKEQLYGRKKEFSNKYTNKGNIVEDNSLDLVAEYFGYGMLIKNTRYFENNYMKGTPDVVLKSSIIDVKSSWDCFTFPLFDDKINMDYFYQGQCYMELADKDTFDLIYVLCNTPIHLVEREAFYFAKNNGYDEVDSELWEQFLAKHNYDNTPLELRIKKTTIQRDNAVIQSIKDRVTECREYINELLKQI